MFFRCRTHKGTGERRVTRADLERVVHLSQQGAASALNIGVTRFKTVCRELGFKSWPYRKVKSVQNLKSTIIETIPKVCRLLVVRWPPPRAARMGSKNELLAKRGRSVSPESWSWL